MIQMQSILDVADNSGAKKVMCVKVLGGSRKYSASIGDVLVVSIKSAIPGGRVAQGDVHKAVLVRQKSPKVRGSEYIRFGSNAVVLLNNQLEPIGTRISGPIPRELKNKNFLKIASLAKEVL